MSYDLTQTDADFFFQMEKFPENEKSFEYPNSGEKLSLLFTSADKREIFHFDVLRGSIRITKITYQSRARKAHVLRRLDLEGPPHINPDVDILPLSFLEPFNGKEIPCPHLHIYVEGFGERWAIPANDVIDLENKDLYEIMEHFFKYCNVKQLPKITKTLML